MRCGKNNHFRRFYKKPGTSREKRIELKMANQDSLSRATAPFQRYIFHFLPGIPILVGICIVCIEVKETRELFNSIITYFTKLPSGEGLLGFTFFLMILIFTLGFVFLFGMIVDSIRHMIEEIFLVPKWSEYKIAKVKDLGNKWDIYDKVHETEYYYIECYGNMAISLAFLWGVITWEYPEYFGFESRRLHFYSEYIIWMLVVFLVRPFFAPVFWKCQESATKSQVNGSLIPLQKGFLHAVKNVFLYRIWDFLATFASIILILYLWKSGKICTQAFHFYFIGVIIITASFELYIVRFKRYKELLTALFLNSQAQAEP